MVRWNFPAGFLVLYFGYKDPKNRGNGQEKGAIYTDLGAFFPVPIWNVSLHPRKKGPAPS